MVDIVATDLKAREATEDDIRLLFADMKKGMKALQAVFAAEVAKLKAEGIDVHGARIDIDVQDLMMCLGKQCLLYRETEDVWKATM